MKTFDKKEIFSWSNCEEAEQYIGKMGFFAENLTELQDDIEHYTTFQLHSINTKDALATFASMNFSKPLFLPIDKVKEEEKRWRPFNDFEEFSKTLNKKIGSEILYRNKDYPLRYIHTLIMGYIAHELHEDLIQIGTGTLRFSDYFKEIEIWNGERWQPFGVEE